MKKLIKIYKFVISKLFSFIEFLYKAFMSLILGAAISTLLFAFVSGIHQAILLLLNGLPVSEGTAILVIGAFSTLGFFILHHEKLIKVITEITFDGLQTDAEKEKKLKQVKTNIIIICNTFILLSLGFMVYSHTTTTPQLNNFINLQLLERDMKLKELGE